MFLASSMSFINDRESTTETIGAPLALDLVLPLPHCYSYKSLQKPFRAAKFARSTKRCTTFAA